MKLSEAVAKFLEHQGIRHVFGVSGGANLHLIHGITNATQIQFIPTAHEQGAGFAADAYARMAGLGCAIVTSGPGATNLVTAIATSYYDSVPVIYITGQVTTDRFGSKYGVRQYGFQETPIVAMAMHITKSALQIHMHSNPQYILEESVRAARSVRMGPVLIDIPDDVQRRQYDPS